jgi:Rho-binding antiterminator
MNTYRPIDCTAHDHLEIACQHRYRVKIELNDGSTITGQAVTTHTEDSKGEFLHLAVADRQRLIRLDRIQCLTVLNQPCAFTQVIITPK